MRIIFPTLLSGVIVVTAFLAGALVQDKVILAFISGLCCVLTCGCLLNQFRRKYNERSISSEEYFSKLIAASGAVYYRTDRDGCVVFASGLDQLQEQFSGASDDHHNFVWSHLTKLIRAEELYRRLNEACGIHCFKSAIEMAGGDDLQLAHTVCMLRDWLGRPTGYCGIMENISDTTRIEHELINERGFLESVMNVMSDLVFIMDFRGNYLKVNNAFARYAGLSHPGACIGLGVHNFFSSQVAEMVLNEIFVVAETGRRRHMRIPVADSTGQKLRLEVHHALHRNPDGEPVAIVGYARELPAADETSSVPKQCSAELLESLAHELRTPVAGMVGGLQVLAGIDISPLAREYVGKCMQSAERLKKVINNFFKDFSAPERVCLSGEKLKAERIRNPENGEAGLNVLLAEDDISSQVFMRKTLEGWGFNVRTAVNGTEVLKCLAEQECDIAFMDIHMPEMNGYEAISRIREMESPDRRMPIIVISAYGAESDFRRMEELNVAEFLAKPVRTKTLKAAVDRVLKSLC